MTIPTDNSPTPFPNLLQQMAIAEKSGLPTDYFHQLMTQIIARLTAGNRVIPCNASGTNVITLTPLDASPLLERYDAYEVFVFAAAATSDGDVTMTVVPKTGSLATLKVYKTDGAAQAGSGDVVADSVYTAIFAPHLDSNAGGFVLK